MQNLRLLIVDDDEHYREILIDKFERLGYEDVLVAATYQEAKSIILNNTIDLYILDFYLDGEKTGLDLVQQYIRSKKKPIIFMSSFYGNAIFDQIKALGNIDFLSKNASLFDIEKSITMLQNKLEGFKKEVNIEDFLLVKKGKKIVKIEVKYFEYIEVASKYLIIHIKDQEYLIRSSLSDFSETLPSNFIRVHQSFIINSNFLESIDMEKNVATVKEKEIAVSRNYKRALLASYYRA